MLDPDLVLAEVVAAIQSITAVITYCDGNADLISGHRFDCGFDLSLIMSVYKQTSPSILVAYKDLLGGGGGGFNQQEMWKHRLEVYLRPGNMASQTPNQYTSPMHLWWLMMDQPLAVATTLPSPSGWTVGLNLRRTTLMSGSLLLMDTPTLTHRQDQEGQDLFVGSCVWPEYGDQ